MAKEDFFTQPDYKNIIDNLKGLQTSDGMINTLLDWERCLDDADLYAYKNWEFGELVEGPEVKRYAVSCTLMYPHTLMPDPRGAKRLLKLGCKLHFKKTRIKVPVKVQDEGDYEPGTHYPKLISKRIWLIRIEIPKSLMNDVREGSIDLAGQTIDLGEIDEAYQNDMDKDDNESDNQNPMDSMDMGQMGGGMGGMGMPPAPGAPGMGGGF